MQHQRNRNSADAAGIWPRFALALTVLVACVSPSDGDEEIGFDEADNGKADGDAPTLPRLRAGETGANVAAVQFLLREHGHHAPATMVLDPTTSAAIEAFQQEVGLTPSGEVDAATWSALFVDVRCGDAGPAVQALQHLLSERYGFTLQERDDAQGQRVLDDSTFAALRGFATDKCIADAVPDACGGDSQFPVAAEGSGSGSDVLVDVDTWTALITGRGACPLPTANSSAEAAAMVLELYDQGAFVGINPAPLADLRAVAAGQSSQLGIDLLLGIVALVEVHGYTFYITSMNDGGHSNGSRHYSGLAFDADLIDGVDVTMSGRDRPLFDGFMDDCIALGGVEVLGPRNAHAYPGHDNHIHCAW